MKTIAVHPTCVQRSSLSLLFCALEAVFSVMFCALEAVLSVKANTNTVVPNKNFLFLDIVALRVLV